MKQDQPSTTAEFMALFRSLESARPPEKRLFNDPLAMGFLRPSLRLVVRMSRIPILGAFVPWYIDSRWPGARTSGIARTRFIDDLSTQALRDEIKQIAILGAGFDSRAYRIPGIERARVFEVDHPDTLSAKRERVRQILGSAPAHVVCAEIDFNRQGLEEVLKAAGFSLAERTFFIWEGVTNYLTEQAVTATLRFVSTSAPGSRIVFTYVHRDVIDSLARVDGGQAIGATLQRLGEPWTFGLDPAEVSGYLKKCGLQLVEDVGSVEYRARYMDSTRCNLKGYEFYRVAVAHNAQEALYLT
jgi:methyltransferase (TIGR00027 family)